MIKEIDPGHRYSLLSLDGDHPQELRFVKRFDPCNPKRFPGNFNAYPGTTLQSVKRVLLRRMRYLQGQIFAPENSVIIFLLKVCLWLLEFRAARRHGKFYWHGLRFAERAPMCMRCGHTVCHHSGTTTL